MKSVFFISVVFLALCGCGQNENDPYLSELFPDVVEDARSHWETVEAPLTSRCLDEANRTRVLMLPGDDVDEWCLRPRGAGIRACVNYIRYNGYVTPVMAISTDSPSTPESLAFHELGHLWNICLYGVWDYDHENGFFSSTP